MNTRFHALFPGLETERSEVVFTAVKREVQRIEFRLNRFDPDSDISTINSKAHAQPVVLDEEMIDIIEACKLCHSLTRGAFDLTLRPLIKHWKEQDGNRKTEDDIKKLRSALGMDNIHLDEEEKSVRFSNQKIELDFGGFGKGYALQRVHDLLLQSDVKSAFISFGESSILALGEHPAGGLWKIGITHFRQPGSAIHQFEVSNGSVSTSSNFYTDQSGNLINHQHVINPFTGKPVQECITVSVKADSAVLAEMLSTALLVLPADEIQQVINQYEGIEVLRVHYADEETRKEIFKPITSNREEYVH